MTEPRCNLTELPRSMCEHCRPRAAPAPRHDDEVEFGAYAGGRREAKFHGRCPCGCGERVEPGDLIEPGDAGWVLAGH